MIAKILYNIRKRIGLNQTEFAEKVGLSRNQYSNYETGRRNANVDSIRQIVTVFNINPRYILTGEGSILDDRSDMRDIELEKENEKLKSENEQLKDRCIKLLLNQKE